MNKMRQILCVFLLLQAYMCQAKIEMRQSQASAEIDKAICKELKKRVESHDAKLADQTLFQKNVAALVACKNLLEAQKILKEKHVENPIWSLHECATSYCPFNRLKNPSLRTEFEEKISQEVYNLFHNRRESNEKDSAINCVSFASGGSLQDLFLGSKVLKKGVPLNLHIIDTHNWPYVVAGEENLQGHVEAFSNLPTLEKIKSSNDAEVGKLMKTANPCAYLGVQHAIYSQLSQWFSQCYPGVPFRLFVYKNIGDYMQTCEQSPELIGNVVTAADFGLERYEVRKAAADFDTLVNYLKNKNNNVQSYLLGS